MPLVEDTLVAVAEEFLVQDLRLKGGERLLVYVDSKSANSTVQALQKAASQKDISFSVAQLPRGAAHSEKERALEALVDRENFDVLCEASQSYFYPSRAWQRARDRGAAIYAIGALDADAFMRCFGSMSRRAMADFGSRMSEILKGARTIEITSEQGTRVIMKMKAGLIRRSWLKLTGRLTRSMVSVPSGELQRGRYTFLPGQICFLGVPASIQGTAVIDGYIWPPPELGTLSGNVVLRIIDGDVTEITGGGEEANLLRGWLNGHAADLKHIGLGFSPAARLTGTLGEAERVFGAVTLGMGDYPFHADAIMTHPTISIDGKTIQEKGSFIDEDLANIQERLMGASSSTFPVVKPD